MAAPATARTARAAGRGHVPELPEVESYRRLAEAVVGRRIEEVEAPDAWYLKRGLDACTVRDALIGQWFTGARRIGKVLFLDTGPAGPTLGVRFGMTGRLVLDGVPGVEELLYASNAADPAWDRFAVQLASARLLPASRLAVRDPRRLG